MKNISTKDLIKEINKRKKKEVPELVETMNNALKTLKEFGIDIEYYNDRCILEKIIYEEVGGELRVFYDDKEM